MTALFHSQYVGSVNGLFRHGNKSGMVKELATLNTEKKRDTYSILHSLQRHSHSNTGTVFPFPSAPKSKRPIPGFSVPFYAPYLVKHSSW